MIEAGHLLGPVLFLGIEITEESPEDQDLKYKKLIEVD